MKYKQLKEITPEAIYLAQSDKECRDFRQNFNEFLVWMNSNFFEKVPLKDLSKYFDNYPEWRDFLIKHGFIEEEQEEQRFKAGAKFVSDNQAEYLLIYNSGVGYRMVCTSGKVLVPHLCNQVIRWDGVSRGVTLSAIQEAFSWLFPKEKS